MSWINREDLMEWLKNERAGMCKIGVFDDARVAGYIQSHVKEMPEMGVYEAMRVLAQYCEDHHDHCYDCTIADYGLCDGGFPIKYRIKDIKDMPTWIPVEDEIGEGSNTYKCPVCWEIQQIEDGTPEENGWLYCPHCGVKLVHEEENNG